MIVTVQATSLLKQGNNISIFKVLGNVLIVPDIADEAVEAAEADPSTSESHLGCHQVQELYCYGEH